MRDYPQFSFWISTTLVLTSEYAICSEYEYAGKADLKRSAFPAYS